MTDERKIEEGLPNVSWNIAPGVNIEVGQKVPIFEHSFKCSGPWGTVVEIDLSARSYRVTCNKCENDRVFINTQALIAGE
ncbi:hypothetical protein A2714_00985 [Candidatus Woesebacteria bacterium RIFCSPHIGHO2_01_FULL_38_9]|uniref:Uncharacterized protein n=2 Tax=Candidatus Woeseibacteriota TaxID=1752722 RepID=A0A1F7XYS9_9BACT|nr:MAG: hypothetical protein A2714_00985 [Candidatus Woesebacteria bacterium RIFCSPHIGHO2_01_FULL_38_9]OGM59567.1 MAG: hypothetical protein A3A75_06000 [Candidatus Woesebacteria bacterium RIFCSPLOWO2_01_FULL_39_10]